MIEFVLGLLKVGFTDESGFRTLRTSKKSNKIVDLLGDENETKLLLLFTLDVINYRLLFVRLWLDKINILRNTSLCRLY